MGRLEGKVAVITGAGQGIGLATAERFAREGARVCLADKNGEVATQEASRMVDLGADAFGVKMDVTSRIEVEGVMDRVVERFGRVDVLVNNAGITRDNFIHRMTDDDWRSVLNVHLTGAFLCSRAAQRHMVENEYGRIVNLSSVSALGNRGQANYAAAKAGLQGFTKTLAVELGRYGVTVNAVAPGFIETEMTRSTAERMGVEFEDFVAEAIKEIPARRSGKPGDVAQAALFFATEEAAFVNGQILYVAGGPRA